MADRPWTLDRLSTHVGGNRAGWSSLGNPGTFAVGAPVPWTADVLAPRCTDFGGQDEGWTCRFRYAPFDNLIDEQQQTRAFAEIQRPAERPHQLSQRGVVGRRGIPGCYTTPSYPPFPLTSTTIMEVAAGHPGRQAFCSTYAGNGKAAPAGACGGDAPLVLQPPSVRELRPRAPTAPRVPHAADRRLRRRRLRAGQAGRQLGHRHELLAGAGQPESAGGLHGSDLPRLPRLRRSRLRRRRDDGPELCGGHGARTARRRGGGAGPCVYYNPFSNAIQYSAQPNSPFVDTANPDCVAGLANPEALRLWLNEEVDLVSSTDMFVTDATVSGNLVDNVADFAVGYQYRGGNADGDPNDPGDVTLNRCPVAGDTGCSAGKRFGPYLFTNVHWPYAADQQVQRLFGELALGIGPRVDTHLAANYEFYNVAGRRVSSFAPKVGWRLQVAENLHYSLVFHRSVQTTFRTTSLDYLNTSPQTTLEWINETGAYQAVDRFGRTDLLPERAFTYNAGTVLFLEAGSFGDLWTDRASTRPLGASDGGLGVEMDTGGLRRLNRSSRSCPSTGSANRLLPRAVEPRRARRTRTAPRPACVRSLRSATDRPLQGQRWCLPDLRVQRATARRSGDHQLHGPALRSPRHRGHGAGCWRCSSRPSLRSPRKRCDSSSTGTRRCPPNGACAWNEPSTKRRLAQRRYEEVDPSNRLVVATLEQRWNDALVRVEEVRTQFADLQSNGKRSWSLRSGAPGWRRSPTTSPACGTRRRPRRRTRRASSGS